MAFILGMIFGGAYSNSKVENFIFGSFLLTCALGIIFMGFLWWLLKLVIFALGGVALTAAILVLLWFVGRKGMRNVTSLGLFVVLFIGWEIVKRHYL